MKTILLRIKNAAFQEVNGVKFLHLRFPSVFDTRIQPINYRVKLTNVEIIEKDRLENSNENGFTQPNSLSEPNQILLGAHICFWVHAIISF